MQTYRKQLSPKPLLHSTLIGCVLITAAILTPDQSRACACGCSVFDVGTSSMFPDSQGGMAFLEYDYQDQNQNWSGTGKAPASNNADKEIRTHFVTAGFQYMFTPKWGMQLEVPYVNRTFKTFTGTEITTLNWGQLGDIRLRGIYAGISDDLSTGVTFGLKVPSGSFTFNDPAGDVDRDSEIGTGSTDLLLGAYHHQEFKGCQGLGWFAQAQLDLPLWIQDSYRPGLEVDEAAGLYYSGWKLGKLQITPVAQIIGSERTSDTGANSANPIASGFERILLSPGIEFHLHPMMLYADVELPVYTRMNGNQLVAPALFKLVLSFKF